MRNSAPGPHAQRSDRDARLELSEIHDRHNHLRMWSYKAAGIDA